MPMLEGGRSIRDFQETFAHANKCSRWSLCGELSIRVLEDVQSQIGNREANRKPQEREAVSIPRAGETVGSLEPRIQQHLEMRALWKACWLGQDHRGRGSLGRAGDPEVLEPLWRHHPKQQEVGEAPWFLFFFLQV